MQCAVLLNVVVCKGVSVLLKLLPCVDDTLLTRWRAVTVVHLQLHISDSVIGGNIQGNFHASEVHDEDLHRLYEVCGVVCICQARRQTALGEAAEESAEMHARRQEGSVSTCGVWHNRRTGSGSAVSQAQKQCPHSATRGQGTPIRVCRAKVCRARCVLLLWWAYLCLWREHHQVNSAVLLNVAVCKGVSVLKLVVSHGKTLLVYRDAPLVLDLLLHIKDGVTWFYFETDCLPCQRLHEDRHL